MSEQFIHLHNHTEYSLLDGAVRVNDLIARAQSYNMSAVAMTDHGVLYGIIDFYKKAQKAGINPILGCEVYLTPSAMEKQDTRTRYHLVLLAASRKGYHNLIKIVSKSWLEGFYYKPRVDKDLLYKYREGLIAMSACLQGEIPQLLLKNQFANAREAAQNYLSIFGRDNFYIELQDHDLTEEKQINPRLIKLAREMEIAPVVTNDIHYLQREDAELQDVMLALKTGTTINDDNRFSFSTEEFYFKSPQEMKALFPKLEDAYKNTSNIADRCRLDLEFEGFYLPEFPGKKEDKTSAEILREKCEEGFQNKEFQNEEEARNRLDYELRIIEEMGYSSYFLIVWDFIQYAYREGIRVGPGRGSAAGSLVSYLLDITRINPLKYGLIFERFLNPQRVTMPDIDIDFDDRRDQIINYVKKRYGQEKVAQIGTFGTMAARGAIRDVGRVLDISYDKVDELAKMVPSKPGITLEEAAETNKKILKKEKEDEEVKEILKYARKLEGMPRHISTHAAGVIIGPEPLLNIVPLQIQDDNRITQLPMEDLEAMGLLKMDFLGLRNLTVIERALDLIEDRFNERLNMEELPRNDPEVYQMLSQGKTLGVFQMESRLFRDLNKRLKPESFTDLIALLALGRPGPLGSGLVDDYIKVRHGEKEPEYLHPALEPILEETFGLILYQEQVMQIAGELADYSMGEADLLRRAMGKKKPELMNKEREHFVKGARKNNIDKETAHEIFDQMEYFGGYGFNKSHSAAYALIAYQTAYLKAKYPAEFMASLLSSVMSNLDKVSKYVEEAEEIGLKIMPPDVNKSDYEFTTTEDGNIQFGLKAIKNVGKNAVESIVKQRKNGEYKSLVDFLQKVDLGQVNIRVIESLIKAGAFDGFDHYRSQMLVKYEDIYDKMSQNIKNHSQNQYSFFDLVETEEDFFENKISFPDIDELEFAEKLSQEREVLGIYISGHPLDLYKDKIKALTNISCEEFSKSPQTGQLSLAAMVTNVKPHITKRQNRMAFLTVEDYMDKMDVVVFPELYNELEFLEEGSFLLILGTRGRNGGMVAHKIFNLKDTFAILKLNRNNQINTDKQVNIEKFEKLKLILREARGTVPVFIQIGNNLILASEKYWIPRNFSSAENSIEKIPVQMRVLD